MANLVLKNNTSGGKTSVTADDFIGNASSATKAGLLSYHSIVKTDADIDAFLSANAIKATIWTDTSSPGTANGILLSGGYTSTNYGFQLAIDDDPSWMIKLRQKSTDGWKEWKRIPMGDGTGASGTWNISITGNATSADTASYLKYAHTDEIDFKGGQSNTVVYFNYRNPETGTYADNTAISEYRFCNRNGSTTGVTVTAANFKGTWNSKSVSDFATASHTHSYLPLSGGTLNGSTDTPLYLKSNTAKSYLGFQNSSGTTLGYFGVNNNNQPVFYHSGDNVILHAGNYSSYAAEKSHTHSYVPLSGGTMTGKLQVNHTIFGYQYTNSNNRAAFMWDKPGSNYTGVGACGQTDMIHFGPCDANANWVASYNQIWRFQGGVYATGWLETDNCGTAAPSSSTPGYGRGGALYFKY